MPFFPILLTGAAQATAPMGNADDLEWIEDIVRRIPDGELRKRHAFIMTMSSSQVAELVLDKALVVTNKPINFNHLLNVLGSVREGKLLVAVYGEDVPAPGIPERFVPVHALGEGMYCVDDAARVVVALVASCRDGAGDDAWKSAVAGAEFMLAMQADDGEFYNFASIENGHFSINKTGQTSRKGVGFWSARAFWGLAALHGLAVERNDPIAARAEAAIRRALPAYGKPLDNYGRYRDLGNLRVPAWLLNDASDQSAVLLLGLIEYYKSLKDGEERIRIGAMINRYAEGLAAAQIQDPHAPDYGRYIHHVRNLQSIHLWGSQQVQALAAAGVTMNSKAWLESAMLCADNYWHQKKPLPEKPR
jgi:hypothetical protein